MSECEFMIQDISKKGRSEICLKHARERVYCTVESLRASLATERQEKAAHVKQSAHFESLYLMEVDKSEAIGHELSALAVRVGELKEVACDAGMMLENIVDKRKRKYTQPTLDHIMEYVVRVKKALSRPDNAQEVLRERNEQVKAKSYREAASDIWVAIIGTPIELEIVKKCRDALVSFAEKIEAEAAGGEEGK